LKLSITHFTNSKKAASPRSGFFDGGEMKFLMVIALLSLISSCSLTKKMVQFDNKAKNQVILTKNKQIKLHFSPIESGEVFEGRFTTYAKHHFNNKFSLENIENIDVLKVESKTVSIGQKTFNVNVPLEDVDCDFLILFSKISFVEKITKDTIVNMGSVNAEGTPVSGGTSVQEIRILFTELPYLVWDARKKEIIFSAVIEFEMLKSNNGDSPEYYDFYISKIARKIKETMN
jgi:hypothetical protein